PRGARIAAVLRMAAVLGITTPDDAPASRIRRTLGWAFTATVLIVGVFLPVVWIPVMAWAYRRGTGALGRRATRFYAAGDADTAETRRTIGAGTGRRMDPLGVLVALRTLAAAVVIPFAAAAFVLLADLRIGDSNLAAASVALIVAGQIAAVLWYVLWRRRGRHRGDRGT
ncbi:MAG: hypothetical protein HOV68_11695, partial [Streptomycetaceae bacterium]|nr:hypothetical protein [Streptomycetaceae bacterium]